LNTFKGHLEELKKSLIRFFTLFLGIAICIYFFAKEGIDFLLAKGTEYGFNIISLAPQEYVVEKIKFACTGALLLCIPLSICMVVNYISENKKKIFLLLAIIILFYLGAAFSGFVMIPFSLKFFVGEAAKSQYLITNVALSKFLGFIYLFLIIFSIIAELPIVFGFLGKSGLVSADFLVKHRGMAIFLISVVSMIITPSDLYSMVLAMIPLCGIYELCIIVVKIFNRKDRRK